MFRITQDPSPGSDQLYKTEITCNGSVTHAVVCVVGVWRHIVNLWCVCACMLRRVEGYCPLSLQDTSYNRALRRRTASSLIFQTYFNQQTDNG
jgi:hypothetical protein